MTYLITAANSMYTLLSHNPPSSKDVATAARQGCNTLISLEGDPDFKRYVRILVSRRVANNEDFDSVTGQATRTLEHFHYFMGEEKRVMLEGGIDPRLVNEIAELTDQLIQLVREWNGGTENLFAKITLAREDACRLANKLEQNKEDEVPSDSTKRHVRRILYVVIGGAIIVLNVIASLNLTPVGTAVSGAVGNALISQAVPAA
jgi:hypothetical protein